ncbi:Sugar transferase involved in LPS biosynthesis (colanic, teichoic acid) [Dethiosulfatibacter aminovorans DSM 17477]|uniref:Sugar transferase involved in LPS biosynthesis (Colanic, teichoic acid) n=1 Tax=Dethiosulfatibacter aminovorans DSM 17477 TaxID=1121476 RepID=A0A1M6E8Q8_9FIRM|nr:sugar transferase [Dethiosulfatibacter aminovorans]SHI81821.1 Sugar transferase involved in LPS biosynthesis (colanic, teichoic acid) [Dethiosulfatibacter aminovorans DSM 17477]
MYKDYIKRLLDIFVSLLLLPVFAIICIPVAIAIKLEDGGPVFYCGERLGKDFEKFNMYKFRSMIVDAPDIRNEDGGAFSSRFDSRVTSTGRILRSLSIDEIPQIINILKGDMSMIGPRPSIDDKRESYSDDYFRKFSIRPGITGYAQAYYRNSISIKERETSDLYYLDNISMKLDIEIILKTIETVVGRKGLYMNDRTGGEKNK